MFLPNYDKWEYLPLSHTYKCLIVLLHTKSAISLFTLNGHIAQFYKNNKLERKLYFKYDSNTFPQFYQNKDCSQVSKFITLMRWLIFAFYKSITINCPIGFAWNLWIFQTKKLNWKLLNRTKMKNIWCRWFEYLSAGRV